MTTLRDVARRAGVSVGSVSTVINDSGPVSQSMRDAVQRAVDELGYAPDGVARSLKRGSTRALGLVIADIANPHFGHMARAIQTACSAASYTMILCNSAEDPSEEHRQLQLLRTQRVDGLLISPAGSGAAYTTALARTINVPAVLIDRGLEGLAFDSVTLNNREAGRLAANHLLGLGHRRIAVITGRAQVSTSIERLAGYRQAFSDAGIAIDATLFERGDFQIKQACDSTVKILKRRPRPTAVFALNNLMTIGVMKALAKHNLSCPTDISVVGMDDFDWASAFAPRLTTVAQPLCEIGTRTVNTLVARLKGQVEGAGKQTVFEPTLVARDSSGPPP